MATAFLLSLWAASDTAGTKRVWGTCKPPAQGKFWADSQAKTCGVLQHWQQEGKCVSAAAPASLAPLLLPSFCQPLIGGLLIALSTGETCWPSKERHRHRQRRQLFVCLAREQLWTKSWEWKMGLGVVKGFIPVCMGKTRREKNSNQKPSGKEKGKN